MNRGSRKGVLFETCDDYLMFERLMSRARERHAIEINAYCLMSNHVHFLLRPKEPEELSRFMHWLTGTHATLLRRQTNTVGEGAVYQSRFLSRPIEGEFHLMTAWRYIERNPVEAGLVERAEEWRWSSASAGQGSRRCRGPHRRLQLDPPPVDLPSNWLQIVNNSFDDLVLQFMSGTLDVE